MSEELVDVHAHFLSARYLDAAVAAGHVVPDGMPGWPSWSADDHLSLMDRHGIAKSLLSVSSPGVHFGDDRAARFLARHVNEFGAEVVRIHPDRFGLFASLPLPDAESAIEEIGYVFDHLGAAGVAVESNAHGRYLGDPLFDPVWAELDRRHAVVFIHPTSPPNWQQVALGRPRPMLEFMFDTTRTVSDLLFAGTLERYRNVRVIIPHGGATLPLLGDRIELFRTLFDTADSGGAGTTEDFLSCLWYDTAGTPFPIQVPTLQAAVGVEHLLYGSDFCFTPASGVADQIAAIDRAPTPAGESWRTLTTRNAARLFGAQEPRPMIGKS